MNFTMENVKSSKRDVIVKGLDNGINVPMITFKSVMITQKCVFGIDLNLNPLS